jgi:hypothetical protein
VSHSPSELSSERGLHFYIYDISKHDNLDTWLGQLRWCSHRLTAVREDFELLISNRNVESRLRSLEFSVENYLTRSYETRERTFKVLVALTGNRKVADPLRHPDQRPGAISELPPILSTLIPALERMLDTVDKDISLRNEQTHGQFLNLGYVTESDLLRDPYDVLVELRDQQPYRVRLHRFENEMRRETKRIAEEYVAKIRILDQAIEDIWTFAEDLSPKSEG